MGRSFHLIIEDGVMDVEHWNETRQVELPDMYKEIAGKTCDEEVLIEWMKRHGLALPIIQTALQKRIIDLRAIARPTVKRCKDVSTFDAEIKRLEREGKAEFYDWNRKTLDITLKLNADKDVQKRLDASTWEPVAWPGETAGKKLVKAAEVTAVITSLKLLLEMGLDTDTVKKKLEEKFSPDVVMSALLAIEKELGKE